MEATIEAGMKKGIGKGMSLERGGAFWQSARPAAMVFWIARLGACEAKASEENGGSSERFLVLRRPLDHDVLVVCLTLPGHLAAPSGIVSGAVSHKSNKHASTETS